MTTILLGPQRFLTTAGTVVRSLGVDGPVATVTAGWWDRQLGLSLLGMAAIIVWEKAVGDSAELAWWEQAAVDGARWL